VFLHAEQHGWEVGGDIVEKGRQEWERECGGREE